MDRSESEHRPPRGRTLIIRVPPHEMARKASFETLADGPLVCRTTSIFQLLRRTCSSSSIKWSVVKAKNSQQIETVLIAQVRARLSNMLVPMVE